MSQPEPAQATLRPLCVDLDGTLVKSDTLVDSLLMLLRKRPCLRWRCLESFFEARRLSRHSSRSPSRSMSTHCRTTASCCTFFSEQHALGRPLYLATGADVVLARRVAAHLGIFSGVLGSDGATNLTGNKKLDGLRTHLGSAAFDYIGNDTPDLPLLAHATEPMVANPSLGLRIRLRARGIQPVREFQRAQHIRSCHCFAPCVPTSGPRICSSFCLCCCRTLSPSPAC